MRPSRSSATSGRESSQPRLLLRSAVACDPAPIELLGEQGGFLERALAELDRPLGEPDRPLGEPARARLEIDRRGRGIAALITQLLATGEPLLVVVADAPARQRHLRARLGGFALASHAALEREPELAAPFTHVVALDPPTSAAARLRLAAAARRSGPATSLSGLGTG